ncbi:hypothetical protein M0Q03_02905 [bacterium]|jgi:hypothetical protein|nr:hypothetical protein [bacterium]
MNFDPESSKLGPEPLMMDSSIAQKILWEEGVVSQHYNECYQLLPADKLDLLLNLRPEEGKFQERGFPREKKIL